MVCRQDWKSNPTHKLITSPRQPLLPVGILIWLIWLLWDCFSGVTHTLGAGQFAEFIVPVKGMKYTVWILCELRTYKWNEAITIKPEKCFRGFNRIQTHGLYVSAAVLYQLSYEDQYVGSRPICWIHHTHGRNDMNIMWTKWLHDSKTPPSG